MVRINLIVLSSIAGPPLTNDTSISQLLRAGVNVAVGVVDEAAARNTRFDLAWVRFLICLISWL